MHAPAPDPPPVSRRRAAAWLAGLLLAGLAAVGLAWFAGQAQRRHAWQGLARQTEAAATLNAALLRSELERHRSLPFVLAEDTALRAGLAQPDPAGFASLSQRLERLREGTGAEVIYLIDAAGMAVAASNWRQETSFVGTDYRFRAYFRQGLAEGSAEQFALGSVSGRPGLYIARRIGPAAAPLGVVVVKVEFGAVEETWRDPQRPLYVTDERGIVLLTNRPGWRFRTAQPLPEAALGALRESLQFGAAPLTPLPLRPNLTGPELTGPDPEALLLDGDDGGRATALLRATRPVPGTGWQLHLLVPAGATLAMAEMQRRLLVLGALLALLALSAWLLHRAGRARRRAGRLRAERLELEARVAARTAELTREIAERERMEARLHAAAEGLQQANRLATLGQIAAGVAHEVNQPLAAIRSYAGNAVVYLGRGETAPAARNLESIIGLTGRIGGITDELRAFARKGAGPVGPVSVAAAVEGAALLLRARLEHQGVPLLRDLPARDPQVLGQQLRLEQVLVNLLQNALDALEGQPGGEIGLQVSADAGWVRIVVRDNGPGLTTAMLAALFVPFSTSKPQGLGLGLVICHDIAAEAGGRIEAASTPGAGACFTLILPELAA